MDLNINNYNLDDLLHVFKLKPNFTQEEFKEAKKLEQQMKQNDSK